MRLSLRRLARVWGTLPIWMLLLLTNLSSVTETQSVPKDERASRVANPHMVQQLPPMLGLPLDCEDIRVMTDTTERAQELQLSLKQIATVKHLSIFGRPLWQIYEDLPYDALREFAIYKLLGGKSLDVSDEHQIFAVLATRLCLDPVLAEESCTLITESVNCHLRIMVGMDGTTGLMKTVTPSEPVVADAAAALLMKNAAWDKRKGRTVKTRLWPVALEILRNKKGLQGEMYSRILCVTARDYAVQSRLLSANPCLAGEMEDAEYMPWSSPVSLLEFLNQLLPATEYANLVSYVPLPPRTSQRLSGHGTAATDAASSSDPMAAGHQVPSQAVTFGEAVKDAYLNFPHFVSTDRDLAPNTTVDLVHDFMRRCAALQLSKNQAAWDLLLPIYFGQPDGQFDASKISVLLIRVKNVKDKVHNLHLSVPSTLKMIGLPKDRPPIIAMMMDLDVEHKHLTVQYQNTSRGSVWGINLYGANAATYRAVDHKDLSGACEALLATLNSTESINDNICQENFRFNLHGRADK